MGLFYFSPSNSLHATGPYQDGLDSYDTMNIVTAAAGGYVVSNAGFGMFLNGSNSVFVSGRVGSRAASGLYLIDFQGGAQSIVSVTATGVIFGAAAGISTADSTSVTNKGTITGKVYGVRFSPDAASLSHDLTNFGLISSGITGVGVQFDGGGAHAVINRGTISGGTAVVGFDGDETISNYGALKSGVSLGAGNDTVLDLGMGRIIGVVDLGTGNNGFLGNDSREVVRNGGGNDVIQFNGGADTYLAVALLGAGGATRRGQRSRYLQCRRCHERRLRQS